MKDLHLKYKLKLLILMPHLFLLFGGGAGAWPWWLGAVAVYLLLMAFQFIGAHRLFAHRSYQTYRAVELILMGGVTLLCLGSPMTWVANHRTHHRHSDQPGDPHSPIQKVWWKVWLGLGDPIPVSSFVVRDLLRDPVQVFIHQHYFKILLGVAVGFYFLAGPVVFRYLVCWPVVLAFHVTGFINVVTHLYGYKVAETGDGSRNNWLVFLVTLGGEGWHNYHHANPSDHRHGHGRFEFDPYAVVIERFLSVPARRPLSKETS